MTNLSDEAHWKMENMMLWTFGHTHFNCDFVDLNTGKGVVANRRRYITEPNLQASTPERSFKSEPTAKKKYQYHIDDDDKIYSVSGHVKAFC